MFEEIQCSEDIPMNEIQWADQIHIGKSDFQISDVIEKLSPMLTDERMARMEEIIQRRSLRVSTVLENIYDRGNVSAAMRSAEAFGFVDFRVIEKPGAKFKAANRVTRGCEKWLDVKKFASAKECVSDLKSKGFQVYVTHLDANLSLETIDWSQKSAFVMGNEKDGVSEEMLELADEKVKIPMMGFSQSFNISVATALLLYHGRMALEAQSESYGLTDSHSKQLLANYLIRCFDSPEKILNNLA